MVKSSPDNDISTYAFDEKALKKFVRQMIKNHTFVGHYKEQRYVPALKCYKKIVKISYEEDIFIENLTIIKNRIKRFYGTAKWIGITFPNSSEAPVGFNLWLDMDEDIFGHYICRVKDVLFKEDEISLKVVLIDQYVDERNSKDTDSIENVPHENRKSKLEGKVDKNIFTWKNIKEASIFMFLLVAAILTGGSQLVMYLMDYILKLVREFSNIIKVSTPIFIACFDSICKMFGYICFLIALLFGKDAGRPSPYNVQSSVQSQKIQYRAVFPYESRYKALPYIKPNSTVKITELNY